MPTDYYPLLFEPIFRDYLWGGRKLQTELNKPIGDMPICAESWEVVDHGEDQSRVVNGHLAGQTLGDLVRTDPARLLGDSVASRINDPSRPPNLQNRFPLLFKFLDANQNLSVQVHPDDTMGATLDPPDLGKTEAWVVMQKEPGARIYAGLLEGVDEQAFRQAIEESRAEELLNSFEPEVGDCIFIPAGTVHALGAGLLIAEIQQCSNTTFRLYDWGRVGADGTPRELHIEQGLAATDFSRGPVMPQPPIPVSPNLTTLVDCDKFLLQHVQAGPDQMPLPPEAETFRLAVVTSGELRLTGEFPELLLGKGQCSLIPANSSIRGVGTGSILLIEGR